MFKLRKGLSCILLGIALIAFPITARAAGNCVEYLSSNEGDLYSTSIYNTNGNYAKPITSYLTTASDGLMLVQAGEGIDGTAVVYYDDNYQVTGHRIVPQELPIFGAFYETATNYYLLTGQNNPDESSSVETFRITKYDKNWNRIASAGLFGANTTVPFRSGCARMAHQGKYLVIHTCHQMYASSDGRNHQSSMTIELDTDTMTITDSAREVSYAVSHSFNQFVRLDGNCIVSLDQGDAYPRAAVLTKFPTDITPGSFNAQSARSLNILSFPGQRGENKTGAALGGFEITGSSYLVVGNSVIQDANNLSRRTRNIFVAVADKELTDRSLTWLTDYEEGDGTTSTPFLVKISSEKYMVLWAREDRIYYTFIDDMGEQSGPIYQAKGELSDCTPLVKGNKVIWYTWTISDIAFYEIDLNNPGTVNKLQREAGHDYTSTGADSTGYATLTCRTCGATDRVKVYTRVYSGFNTNGSGTYGGLERQVEVGTKIYCACFTDPIPYYAQDVVEILIDDPTVVTAKKNLSGGCSYLLTVCGPGTAHITLRSRYNPTQGETYTLVAIGEPEPEPVITDGLHIGTDGTWYYYTNGQVNTAYTGMACNEYGWWYVKNGAVDLGYTGMAENEYGWWYYQNGQLDWNYTGMAENEYGWWYYRNGRLDWNYTGMAENEYGWWYYQNGRLDWNYTGMAENEYGWWYYQNGRLDWNYTGMAENEYGWWYYQSGRLDWNYTGMAENEYGWWYYQNGRLDWNYTGIGYNEYGRWYYQDGRIDFNHVWEE